MISISWHVKSLWNTTAEFLTRFMIDANSDQKCIISNS